jgi:hypothetical protein
MHERTAFPFRITVQEPQAPRSHISLVPVKQLVERPLRFDLHPVFLPVDRDVDYPLRLGRRFRFVIGEDMRLYGLIGIEGRETIGT